MPDDIRLTTSHCPGLPGARRLDQCERRRRSLERLPSSLTRSRPAGGTMHTKAVFHAAKALARIGCPVLRFNFRGVGRSAGMFDERPRRTGRFPAALDFMTGALTRMWRGSGPAACRSVRGWR